MVLPEAYSKYNYLTACNLMTGRGEITYEEFPADEIEAANTIVLEDEKTPENILFRKSALDTLSEEAQKVIELILDAPEQLMAYASTLDGSYHSPKYKKGKKVSLTNVEFYIRDNWKWKWEQIWSTTKEIRRAVSLL